jgi:hypothetical protein
MGSLEKLITERVSTNPDRWILFGWPRSYQEREEIAGRLQWTNGGAMAGITETSPEFTVLATRTIIQQTGSTKRK